MKVIIRIWDAYILGLSCYELRDSNGLRRKLLDAEDGSVLLSARLIHPEYINPLPLFLYLLAFLAPPSSQGDLTSFISLRIYTTWITVKDGPQHLSRRRIENGNERISRSRALLDTQDARDQIPWISSVIKLFWIPTGG
jgi:hypothetical protein